jgi:hypothetical protein
VGARGLQEACRPRAPTRRPYVIYLCKQALVRHCRGEMQEGPSLSPEREGRAMSAMNKSPVVGVCSFL